MYLYIYIYLCGIPPKDPRFFVGIWIRRIETTVVQAVDRLKPIEVIEIQSGIGFKIQDSPAILNPGSKIRDSEKAFLEILNPESRARLKFNLFNRLQLGSGFL